MTKAEVWRQIRRLALYAFVGWSACFIACMLGCTGIVLADTSPTVDYWEHDPILECAALAFEVGATAGIILVATVDITRELMAERRRRKPTPR